MLPVNSKALFSRAARTGVRAQPCSAKRIARSIQTKAASIEVEFTDVQSQAPAGKKFELACPICNTTKFYIDEQPTTSSITLDCPRCNRSFSAGPNYVDLTLASGLAKSYEQKAWGGTEIFRQNSVSSIYERGWRQSFAFSGFPGVDVEFGYAMDYLRPAYGETLVDMSCGTGLFTRKFASSGKFKGVIAADYSETMLQQTRSLMDSESIDMSNVLLLRTDVARLPFETGSVAAIHAGAAIHCWPNPEAALAEISRVLKPGGLFVGSTFLEPVAPLGELLGSDRLVQAIASASPSSSFMSSTYKFWLETELSDLFKIVGLEEFQRQRNFRFILWSCRKPMSQE